MNAQDLHKIMPLAGPLCEVFAPHLNAACMAFNVSSRERQAAFLATISHESGQLRSLAENLNYGAPGLIKNWPSRFPTMAVAQAYARNPEKIANKVYADRMGNGNEASGDGFKHRGFGLIMATGKTNQADIGKQFGIALDAVQAWLQTPEGASQSAAYLWRKFGCNELADKGKIQQIRKVINGGLIGLDEFVAINQTALRVLV